MRATACLPSVNAPTDLGSRHSAVRGILFDLVSVTYSKPLTVQTNSQARRLTQANDRTIPSEIAVIGHSCTSQRHRRVSLEIFMLMLRLGACNNAVASSIVVL